MDNFKALISDFDGTLTDSTYKLSPQVKEAILNIVKQGICFSIATGRPYHGIVKKVCQELNLISPQIVSGGALIVDPKTDQVLWGEYFPINSAKKLIDSFIENNYDFAVESEGCVFVLNSSIWSGYGPGIVFQDFKKLKFDRIAKIVLEDVSSIGDSLDLEEEYNKLYPDLHFIRSGINKIVFDITSEKATKHLAVLELSKILKINPKEMIGIGDGYNDYPLLSICGYKVAMGSAPKELKEIADLIVPDVSQDGLVTLIRSLYNGQ